jgi:hypothetical protein
MRQVLLGLAIALASTAAFAAKVSPAVSEKKLEQMLMKIDPSERFIQACSAAAADYIARDKNPYKADRAVMDAISPAQIDGDKMHGAGAAFRSRGEWYQFSFTCETSDDHLKVKSFNYKVGDKIPEDKWESLGLWQ